MPNRTKIDADFKIGLKEFHTMKKTHKFLIELAGNDHTNVQVCIGKAGLNLRTYRKLTDLSDVGTVIFR